MSYTRKMPYANQNTAVKIDSFVGKYRFLSNSYQCSVAFGDIAYDNAEAAFQAQKCEDPEDRKKFVGLNSSEAYRLGRKVKLRYDWDLIKDSVMYDVVFAKFKQNRNLTEKLLQTGSAALVKGNTRRDRHWGQVNGIGKNMLGKILMHIREQFGGCGPMDDDLMPLPGLNN